MTRSWLMSELDGLLRLQSELDRVLERPSDWFSTSTFGRGAFPPVNIFRSDGGYVVRIEVPGLPLDGLSLETKGDALKVSGKRTAEEDAGSPHRRERWGGEFARTVQLPKDADLEGAEASYKHGVLNIRVPYRQEVQPRRIAIASESH